MMGARAMSAGRALHADSPATAFHEKASPEPGDLVVRKVRVGAFSTTDLDQQLRERGVDTLLLAGLSTSGVVLSTVRDAHDRDYQVFVLSDLTGDPDPELHRVPDRPDLSPPGQGHHDSRPRHAAGLARRPRGRVDRAASSRGPGGRAAGGTG